MRVAVILKSFPVVSETFILRQITGLIDRGHEVEIYARTPPDETTPVHPEVTQYDLLRRTTYVDTQAPAEFGYWQMPVWPLTGETWLPGAASPIPNIRRALRAVPTFLRCAMIAPRLTKQALDPREYGQQALNLSPLYRLATLAAGARRYDVLHVHYGPVGNMFRFARSLFGAPMIVTFHGYDFSQWPRLNGASAYRQLFTVVDRVTVNSRYARARLEELGCTPEKISQLNVGVDPDEFPYRPRTRAAGEPIRLLSVSRLVEKKGLEYAIRAVAAVRERHQDLTYDIVGEGQLRPHLQDLIHELGVERTVTLVGARDGDEVRKLMEAAHIFVLPSVTAADGDQEGTPVSLMEAQSSGLPVVSTWHSGIPEVVLHEKSGFLVTERDTPALTDRLLFLVEHPEIWPGFGRAGRANIVERYDIRQLNDDLVELYEHVIADYSARRGSGRFPREHRLAGASRR